MSKFYNSLKLKNSVGNNLANDPDDVIAVKSVMTRMGRLRLDPDKAEPHAYLTRDLDEALKSYQKERGLRVDGIMFPGGETEKSLNYELKQLVAGQEKNNVESEKLDSLPPKPDQKIPGTNIPDRGIPEQGIPGSRVFDPYRKENGMNAVPLRRAKVPNPSIDPHMKIPHINDRAPWEFKKIDKKI